VAGTGNESGVRRGGKREYKNVREGSGSQGVGKRESKEREVGIGRCP
jgi:hypothetical protein